MATKFVTNLDLNQNQILNGRFEVLGADPGSGNFEGRMIYRSDLDVVKYHNGSAWKTLINSVAAAGSYTEAVTISNNTDGTVSITLNLADTNSAGLLSATFWNLLNGATDAATGSTLAKRDSSGQIKVASTPTDDAHAASKGYVDSAISGATVSTEQVQDIVGAQIATNGSHTGITATYQDSDADGAIDLALDATYTPTFAGLTINGASITFEGATANDYETILAVTDPTADRTITLPNATGTVALTSDLPTSMFAGIYGNSGFTNLTVSTTGGAFYVLGGPGVTADVTASTITVNLDSTASPTFAGLTINGASITFEGTTANAFETTITVTDPTEDRTITVPNVSGTVITTGNLSSITSVGTLDSLTITGDLTVNGTTTTINSTTVTVDDKNLELGSTASPSDSGADGGGITLKGTTDKTFVWVDSTDAWTSSEHLNLVAGKSYYINGTQVLSATTLGSGVTGSSLTSVGTITSGTWNGTDIAVADGGTGASDAAGAKTNLGFMTRYATSVGDTTNTSFTITHNLGTRDVVVQIREVASPYAVVIADIAATTTNTVTVAFATAPTTDQYRVVVIG